MQNKHAEASENMSGRKTNADHLLTIYQALRKKMLDISRNPLAMIGRKTVPKIKISKKECQKTGTVR